MQDHEKRTKTRLVVTDDVLVRDNLTNAVLGKLANIHEEGFMVMGQGSMQEDQIYTLQLELSTTHIRASAECLWTSATGSGANVWAGFTFLNVHEEDHEKLRQLILLFQP